MSSFDDDEALFEDIYDDDTTSKTEAKATEEPGKEPAPVTETPSTSAPASTTSVQDTTSATPEPTHTAAPVAILPPTSVPEQSGQQSQPEQQNQYASTQPQYGTRMPQSNVGRDSGKMFIGGLNWDTTEDGMVAYFSKYGEILDYTIMKDPNTGRSRGFGFLTFRDPRSVDEVIKKDHILDGKLIDPKRAIAREEQDKIGKIFVGGIDPMVNERDFSDFFSQFGRIIDAQLMVDKDTGRSRGFGFITFDSPDAVDRVCVNKYLTLKGKSMEVKRAEPRGQTQVHQPPPQQYNPYANAYGQMQMQYAQSMPNFQGNPEMMQEYWQRMQQWYMMQQQQSQEQEQGAEEPDLEPLNPQQQGSESPEQSQAVTPPEGPKSDRRNRRSRGRGGRRRGGSDESSSGNGGNANYGGGSSGNGGSGGQSGGDRMISLPKGPKGVPTGPSSGGGGNGGNGGGGGRSRRSGYKKGGFHPYKGGRR